jgi:hypothetical protein
MKFNQAYKTKFIQWYLVLLYILAAYKWFNGQWFYQFNTVLFNTRFDGVSWLFMQVGLHKFVAANSYAPLVFDIAFYSMPAIFYIAYLKNAKLAASLAVLMFVVNWLYVQVFTLFPTNSIEGHVVWLLYPIIFMAVSVKNFYFLVHAARYYFLYFFVSAGIWKLVHGGIFNPQQMSAVLINQHKELLVSSPDYWLSNLYYWLIGKSTIGYALYIIATLLELSFVIGFFTKKYDKLLIWLFLLFLIFDHFIMRIPYYEILPLMLPLLFSRLKVPERE